jgi:AraC family transcriptional regulator
MVSEPESYAAGFFEAELTAGIAHAGIARFALDRPTNRLFRPAGRYWLDMCLSPRPEKARGCYRERWGPHRYEPLGEIFLVPSGEALHVLTDGGADQRSIVCELQAEAVERWLPGGIEWTDRRLASSLDIVHPHMRSCLYRLAEEAARPGAGSQALTELIAGQLAIEVARYCQAIAEGPIAGGLSSWRLRRIDERLQQPGPPPSLGELADLCGLSVRQLTRGFKTSRGCSIGDYLAQGRILTAKRLLGASGNIKEIAFALGFASPSSFSYAFRRAVGSTPRQFRARQLQKRR